ncbi:hypothetical protein GGR54DRAFT_644917 [Hypoxylon sp. NC1633]|nr:hypothetical protein GGR54DRAFT_644917 [Hypoxylon sp. NC1633]
MFSIDRSLLPSLPTRRALIVVDPQTEFLSEDGALPVKFPMNLPERIADLVTSFRQGGGDIIWVCSRFEKSRSALDEQILTSDRSSHPRSPDAPRGRRRQASPQIIQPCECPEAFLTQECSKVPKCVRAGSFGIEMHPTLKVVAGPRDYSLTKSYYSAFRSEQLLRLLRMRVVMELFICGSMTNISIMATAVDAASHGYNITIVDDCCGYNNVMRHRDSIKQMSNTAGCDIRSAEDVLATFRPKPKLSRRSGDRPTTSPAVRFSTVRHAGRVDDPTASSTSKILSSFENLSLSAERAADTPNPEPLAEDSPLPIQPLVRPIDAKTAREPESAVSASKSDEIDSSAWLCKNLDCDESQRDCEKISDNRAQSPALDKESSSLVRSNSIVAHDVSKWPRQNKANVSKQGRIRGDEAQPPAEASDPSFSSQNTLESTVGSPIETPKERMEAPPEIVKAELDSSNTMAAEVHERPRASEPLCEGDTKVVYDILPKPLSEKIFERIRDEVRWQRMSHQGGEVPRLISVQGQVDRDGSMPVYRHPADESPPLLPFSPAVLEIKEVVEKQLGHPLNHVLIQFYRDGHDCISEHSDKTLDIVKGTFIANVSLGAERIMTFRTKRRPGIKASADAEPTTSDTKRQVERAPLPHNSLCQMGLKTNMRWLHSIRQDKRMNREKTEEELAYDGGRISLTFRQIGTFLDQDNRLIWGQGATSKTREAASHVINGQTQEAVKMLQAFGRENQSTGFDWDGSYGNGFDVLHISTAPRLFLSPDPVVNMRIQLMLAEFDLSYARGSMSPLFNWRGGRPTEDPGAIPEDLPIKFVDNDLGKTVVQGEVAIMLYLDHVYNQKARVDDLCRRELAKEFTRFQQGLTLLDKYRASPDNKTFKAELRIWESYASEGEEFIAGPTMTLADYALWPVLDEIIRVPGRGEFGDVDEFENLRKYYEHIRTRESGKKVLIVCAECLEKKPDCAPNDIASSRAPAPA